MYKVLHFLKRKEEVTHEEFKAHFERSHAAMAIKFCGHLFLQYRRNYFDTVFAGGDSRDPNSGYSPRPWQWDMISEWILPDEASLNEIYRVMQLPEYDDLFHADEDRFIDRRATVTVPCEVADVGTTFSPRNTVFDTPSGEPSWDGWQEKAVWPVHA